MKTNQSVLLPYKVLIPELHMSTESKKPEGVTRDALTSFYLPPPDDLPENARKLLEDYSKIPAEQVLPHVVEVVR